MESKTIQSLAQEMYDNFEYAKRNDGTEFIKNIKDITWQKDIIYKAHQESSPNDYIYDFILEAVEILSESKAGLEDDAIYERIEADVYTSNLTAWLHDNNGNVYYLESAISQGVTDGFQLLMMAQLEAKREVASIVLGELRKLAEGA